MVMNTYLISGTSNYFIEKEIDKIVKDNSKVTVDLNTCSIDELLNEASFSSLFNDKKYLIIKNCVNFYASKKEDSERLKKENERLYQYLTHENPSTYLIFYLTKNPDSKKKITKIITDAGNNIKLPSLNKTQIKEELKKIVEGHKFDITDDSLWHIVNNSLNNFDIAQKELEKIFLYYESPTMIKLEDVKALVSKNIKDNNFELIDAIINRNLKKSLEQLSVIKVFKTDPTIIFLSLASEFRKALDVLIMQQNKYSYGEILSELGIMDFQYQKYQNIHRLYTKKELQDTLLNLSKLDVILKSQNYDKELLLYKYILENCE